MRIFNRFRFAPVATIALAFAAAACDSDTVNGPGVVPVEPTVDANLRSIIRGWGVVPILPIKAQDPAVVELGRMLFFDKLLSGNRDVSCATCHNPLAGSGDEHSLAIGTGAVINGTARTLGANRQFTPRNAPGLFNAALGAQYMFWDGRVNEELGFGRVRGPNGAVLPSGLSNLLAAQAMHPVTNRVEMRGMPGDRDVKGNVNELAEISDNEPEKVWDAAMRRLLAETGYLQRFNAAFPTVPASALRFQHAANAIAAFEAETFTKTNSPFDRYLARDDNAISAEAKQGAMLFFTTARCATCHNGAMLGGQQFANVGVPQLGPGTGAAAPLDAGREDGFFGSPPPPGGARFMFRVPPLRNVELTAPYFHNGAYSTLESVVRHYNNVDSALKAYDPSQLEPALRATYRGDAATISKVLTMVDGRLRGPIGLTAAEQQQIVAFLKSLTDPAARTLAGVVPAAVPSGLSVR